MLFHMSLFSLFSIANYFFFNLHLQCVFFTHTHPMLPKHSNHGMGSRMHKVTAKSNTQCLRHGNVPSPVFHFTYMHWFILSIKKLNGKSLRLYSSKSHCSSAKFAFQLPNFFIPYKFYISNVWPQLTIYLLYATQGKK